MTLKIINLIKEINRDPFRGQGNPEKLKHELSGSYAKH
ncbi:type II toxin-antitoxin system YoeB family toxin [Candidatus Magnetobacterium casense]